MKIRPATLTDLPALMAIESQADTAAHWSEPKYREMFSGPPPKRLVLVAESGQLIQGFLVARAIADEWEIENVVVAPAAQRKGLGSALIEECLRLARQQNASAVFLEVRESNQPARSLYEKMNFRATGRRPHYYQNHPEDALVYRLEIPEPAS